MPTTYTSLLGLALPATGELAGTWGDTVNAAITSLLDAAIAGTTTLSTDANVTLTTTTGAANQARQQILLCTGARTAQRTITAPAQSKTYFIINDTTGGFGVQIVGVGPTPGVTVAAGESALVAWNGSGFVRLTSTTTVTGTATRIPFFDAGGALSSDANFVRDASGSFGFGTSTVASWRATFGFDGSLINGLRVNDASASGTPTLLQVLKNGLVRFEVLGTGNATLSGALTANSFSGTGTALTALNASNLGSGTVPDARFPATLPAASGVNLTALNATQLTTGTVPDARFPATLPAASGANLTALNASNLGSGTVPAARVGTSTVYGMGDGSTIGGLEIGYKNIPRGADQTINTAKRGRVVVLTAGATIPSATFSADDTFALYNNTAASLTITQGAGLTMFGPNAATGNRTLAARGWATVWFNAAGECKILGEVT